MLVPYAEISEAGTDSLTVCPVFANVLLANAG